ncbi:hypothetical protein BDC45DRAFT_531134 [Circinella umbellata]|nr:hypothetical protein BDC45DRAFT_531134 [Circinella umbellata]
MTGESNAFRCKDCNVDFKASSELYNHNYRVHVNKTKVVINKEIDTIIEVNKIGDKFNCPECPSKLSTPTTFNIHLKNKHDSYCKAISKGKKRLSLEDDNNDGSTSVSLKHQKLPSAHLTLDESDSTQSQKEPQNDKNTVITLASSTFLGSTREKENSIMLAKIGNLEPVTLKNKNGKNYHFLTSPENIDQVLTDQPSGS